MRMQLAQQAQEILGQSDLVVITERVDDVALLIGQMVKMGLVEVLDRHLPRHWKQRRVSWGWTAVIWLAYILTEGDHRKSRTCEVRGGITDAANRLLGPFCAVGAHLSASHFLGAALCLLGSPLCARDFSPTLESFPHLLAVLRRGRTDAVAVGSVGRWDHTRRGTAAHGRGT